MEGRVEEVLTGLDCRADDPKIRLSRVPTIFKNPFIIILTVLFLLFLFHPTLFNLGFYFGKSEEPVPMNYVSNFYLWTRQNKNEPEKLIVGAREELLSSHFRNRFTYVIVHGFTCSGLVQWIQNMKDALLWREDCNVISVDWQAGSLTAGYYVKKARVPAVGEDISKLAIFLRSNSELDFLNLHLIGHSLGAHVVGFAGKYLNSSVGRITGLDPAGLGYSTAPHSGRLDKSDAAFVDVVHTHGCYAFINKWTDCYGTYQNMGHADFWPNGGEKQPACDEVGQGVQAVREAILGGKRQATNTLAMTEDRQSDSSSRWGIFNIFLFSKLDGSNCHHRMAYEYYTSSIYSYSTSTRFFARKCPSWELFNNGSCSCGDYAQYMGHNANPRHHGVFYLNTSKSHPFGILEPHCSPGRHLIFKVTGVFICVMMVALLLWTYLANSRISFFTN